MEERDNTFAYEILKIVVKMNLRFFIVILVLLIGFIGSNLAWLYAWQSYDYESTTTAVYQESTDGGNVNYTGKGDITNGETGNNYNDKDKD